MLTPCEFREFAKAGKKWSKSRLKKLSITTMAKNGYLNHVCGNQIIEKKKNKDPPLFRLESCPPWLQFNRYILGDYRCNLSTTQCVDSLFYVHNETFNIYSHGIPCAIFVVLIPLMASAACLADPVWFFIHYCACFAPFLASPIYHLFMCHQYGQDAYNKLLTLDVCGIWVINAFGGLCGIRATFYCLPFWQFLSVAFYIVVSLMCIYFILVANSAKERFKPFAVFGIMRYFFVAVRLSFYTFNITKSSISAWPYYLSMDILAFIGGALNVARIPERWFPGKCDIIGNSHQIMHVVTVMSVVCLHIGSVRDFHWMSETFCGFK